MIFASTIVTYAADPYLSFGSKTGNVNVKKYADKYNDTWVSVIDNGISAWNNSSANISISKSSSSKNSIEAARYDDTKVQLRMNLDTFFGYVIIQIHQNHQL